MADVAAASSDLSVAVPPPDRFALQVCGCASARAFERCFWFVFQFLCLQARPPAPSSDLSVAVPPQNCFAMAQRDKRRRLGLKPAYTQSVIVVAPLLCAGMVRVGDICVPHLVVSACG